MYKPLQIEAPQTRNAKKTVKSPLQIQAPPGACTLKLPSNTKYNKAKTVHFFQL